MQKLLSIIVILLSATSTYCQQADNEGSVLLNNQPNWERLLKNRPAIEPPTNASLPPQNSVRINILPDTARYSHRTAQSNVYTLPFDNMPCLVPDQQNVAAMPGTRIRRQRTDPTPYNTNRMPNTFGQKPLIFEQPAQPVKK